VSPVRYELGFYIPEDCIKAVILSVIYHRQTHLDRIQFVSGNINWTGSKFRIAV
jgi:hypothetical protein